MRTQTAFKSYEQFKDEVLRHRTGPLTSAVDDLVEETFHAEADNELDSLWDSPAGDDD